MKRQKKHRKGARGSISAPQTPVGTAGPHATGPAVPLLLEDHSLDIPPFLERKADGSMRYPGLAVTAAVKEFEMPDAELQAQVDRMEAARARDQAARDDLLTQEAARAHASKQKTPEQKEEERKRRIEKQKRKAHSLQMERIRYFNSHKPTW